MDKKIVVISGVNLIDAGPLSVFLDFLEVLIQEGYSKKYRIIALVGKKELFSRFESSIELIEFRNSKSSWFTRLYLEYFYFNKLSKKLNVYIWISMHDITPNVKAEHRFVYCHNPSPFNSMSIKEAKFGFKYYLFSKFYKYLYKINIHKNDAVIVQQNWMRHGFIEMYKLKNVIVARPSLPKIESLNDTSNELDEIVFVCPSFPRYYKNFQVVCEAASLLEKEGLSNFKLYVTLSGDENKYARFIKDRYKNIASIIFCGVLSRDSLFELYSRSKCLIFMSKLETWGMPITEYKYTNKSMIVSNLPYAHETVGEYNHVAFSDPDNTSSLSKLMKEVIDNGCLDYKHEMKLIDQPYAIDWISLCKMILK